MAFEGLQLKPIVKKKAVVKKKTFNFKTNRKAENKNVRTPDALVGKTKDQLIHGFKVLTSRKKLTSEEKNIFIEVKKYLKARYHIG